MLNSGSQKILLVMPSNLRKQWQVELDEKFEVESLIVESGNWDEYKSYVKNESAVVIVSYNFASRRKSEFAKVPWSFCVFDEAHRLRNVYKNGSKMASNLYELTKGIPKLMLTATPMQNSLFDLYGLIQFIDKRIFYSKAVFSDRYIKNEQYEDLRHQVNTVLQRTLRKEVSDYIQFPERKEVTVDFELSLPEVELYMKINNYLKKEILFALPNSHRSLITSVIRKLLASSSMAVAETFRTLKNRLVILKETTREESVEESLDFFFGFFDDDEVEDEQENDNVDQLYTREKVNEFIQHEIDEIDDIINTAEKIKKNAKMTALKTAVRKAFDFQRDEGIKEKVVIFTESVRTQQYIFEELSKEGYQGQILKFNGSSGDDTTKELFRAWRNRNYGKYFGSRNVELKNAIVQAFKEDYKILLVTDSGSEGLNLQFCNTIINYDLPWNPQKIEQRIGRCHRYGQKNDVVVFNLLNTQNVADKRVYEILSNKFELFQGVFGASDRAIGLLESGADFEKRVSHIYQECKTSKDFLKEFTSLERELDRKRNKKMEQLKSLIIREASEQHKETFERILSDIQGYQNQLDYWGKVNISHKQVIYPRFYKLINGLNIPGIEHGYLLIGGYYAGEELIQSVFQVSDEKGKIYAAKDELIRILTSSLMDDNLIEESPDNVAGIIKDVDEYLFQEHADKCKILIFQNDERIENWTNLRKEEFILSIKDSSEIDDLRRQYQNETNFKEKIAIKKRIDELGDRQKEREQSFHKTVGIIEKEAQDMKVQFEENLLKRPVLFTKIVVKF